MLNCAVLMGRLTAEPELRQTESNKPVVKFTIAVDRGFAKAGEEKKADFINIVCWNKTAEFVSKYFHKGDMIAVQGSIQTGSYEKDGVKRYTFDVVADNVSFCGSKGNGEKGETPEAPSGSTVEAEADEAFDDLPF